MDLNVKYQYSNFIYPFLILENRYERFLEKLFRDRDNWTFKIHDTYEDHDTAAYFLPYVKKFIFPTLEWDLKKKSWFERLSADGKASAASRMTCAEFRYRIEKTMVSHCELSEEDEIGFNITDIILYCYEPGIAFLVFRTHLEGENAMSFYNVLDFNYKFRTINPYYVKEKKTGGIYLKCQEFKGIENLSGFIEHLLYGLEDTEKEDIYFDRLFTYSYVCLEKEEWDENRSLSDVINEFYKFQYVLPGNYGSTFAPDFKGMKENTYSRWMYSIYGFSKEAGVVLSSETENFNMVKLPRYYNTIYFYILMLAFYHRVTLILLSRELVVSGKERIEKLRKQLLKFSNFSWFSQITNSEQGMDIWKKWQKVFDLHALFDEVQKEYIEFYEYNVAKGQDKINRLLIFLYTVSVALPGLALTVQIGILPKDSPLVAPVVALVMASLITFYPIYAIGRFLFKKVFSSRRKI